MTAKAARGLIFACWRALLWISPEASKILMQAVMCAEIGASQFMQFS